MLYGNFLKLNKIRKMIGIISAMSEEIDLLLDEMSDAIETISAGRTYYQGKIQQKDVVIVFSKWGKVASAITATELISNYHVTEIIFAGVAGAINEQLNIGDIVIGNKLYQHDMNASPIYSEYEIPLLNTTFFETNIENSIKLYKAASDFIKNFELSKNILNNYKIVTPNLLSGTIGSGDQFISDNKKRDELKLKTSDLLCVEMEGAAVAQVCHEFNIPYSIVRIISDNANDDAAIDFQSFVSEIASIYTLKILTNYLKN